jgi:uncharacterized protein
MQERKIVDADGHYLEIADDWARYLTAEERQRFGPKTFVDANGIERFAIGDLYMLPAAGTSLMGNLSIGDGGVPRKKGAPPEALGRRILEADPGGLYAKPRLALMDEEGIAVSVLYPTLALAGLPSLGDAEAASALGRSLNDWVAEHWAAADPERLVPVATIPLHDPAWAARELERCVRDLGMKAGWVSPVPVMGRVVDAPEHDVVWEKAAELGVPITTHHGSGGGGLSALGRDRNQTWLGSHAMGHVFEGMAAIVGLYTSRVFQRFPTVRWGFFEAGSGWLPFWLEQIEEHAERMSWLVPGMGEDEDLHQIFAERCVVTAEGDDEFVNSTMDATAQRCVVWASDYPHFDCEVPITGGLRQRKDLDDQRFEALAVDNALDFFGLRMP